MNFDEFILEPITRELRYGGLILKESLLTERVLRPVDQETPSLTPLKVINSSLDATFEVD